MWWWRLVGSAPASSLMFSLMALLLSPWICSSDPPFPTPWSPRWWWWRSGGQKPLSKCPKKCLNRHPSGCHAACIRAVKILKSATATVLCYSVCYSHMRSSVRPYGCPHETPDLAFSSNLRATVLLQWSLQCPRTQKRHFRCRIRLTLRCRAPWASLMPIARNKPIKP